MILTNPRGKGNVEIVCSDERVTVSVGAFLAALEWVVHGGRRVTAEMLEDQSVPAGIAETILGIVGDVERLAYEEDWENGWEGNAEVLALCLERWPSELRKETEKLAKRKRVRSKI